jgi:hypothetical protein
MKRYYEHKGRAKVFLMIEGDSEKEIESKLSLFVKEPRNWVCLGGKDE